MSEKAGVGEKVLLFGRNFSLLGAAALGAITLLPGAQPTFAYLATNFLIAGVGFEVGRHITKNVRSRLGKAALS